MQTRSQSANTHTSQARMLVPPVPVRPNARGLRDLFHYSILNIEERIAVLEKHDALTDAHKQSVMRISKMLETMCGEFKVYHYEIVAGIESDKAAT